MTGVVLTDWQLAVLCVMIAVGVAILLRARDGGGR